MENCIHPEFSDPPETAIPQSAYDVICRLALDALAFGETRFSVREALEYARSKTKLAINNNVAPLVSDSLVNDYPQLARIIERRARGTRGQNRERQLSRDLGAIGTAAEVVNSTYGPDVFEIVGVQVRKADGGTSVISIERLRDIADRLVVKS